MPKHHWKVVLEATHLNCSCIQLENESESEEGKKEGQGDTSTESSSSSSTEDGNDRKPKSERGIPRKRTTVSERYLCTCL